MRTSIASVLLCCFILQGCSILWHCEPVKGPPASAKLNNCTDGKGRIVGWHYEYFNGRLQYKTRYRKGIKHGKAIEYGPKNNIQTTGRYKKGKYHGKWSSYWSDGTRLGISNYKNGKLEGWQYGYVPSNCTQPCPKEVLASKDFYVNDKREGNSYHYGLDGNLKYIEIYNNDSLIQTLYP